MRCIFTLLARRHWRGKEMRNAKPPRAATHRDQLLESDAHTSIKRVRASRKTGTRFPALPPRGTLESAAATNRFALLASFVPLFFCFGATVRNLLPARFLQTCAFCKSTVISEAPAGSKHCGCLKPSGSKHRRGRKTGGLQAVPDPQRYRGLSCKCCCCCCCCC